MLSAAPGGAAHRADKGHAGESHAVPTATGGTSQSQAARARIIARMTAGRYIIDGGWLWWWRSAGGASAGGGAGLVGSCWCWCWRRGLVGLVGLLVKLNGA